MMNLCQTAHPAGSQRIELSRRNRACSEPGRMGVFFPLPSRLANRTVDAPVSPRPSLAPPSFSVRLRPGRELTFGTGPGRGTSITFRRSWEEESRSWMWMATDVSTSTSATEGRSVPGNFDGRMHSCRLYRNLGEWRFQDITDRCGAPGPASRWESPLAITTATAASTSSSRATATRSSIAILATADSTTAPRQRGCRHVSGPPRPPSPTSTATAISTFTWPPTSTMTRPMPRTVPRPTAGVISVDRKISRRSPAGSTATTATAPSPTCQDTLEPAGAIERGLGVLIADLTGDRIPDIYVANDGGPGWLLANRGNLRFEEIGQQAGVARDAAGVDPAGMGVALGDLDGDGRSDLAVTNFLGRSTIAFRRIEAGSETLYRDDSAALGITAATRPVLGFGIAIEDFDGDGRLDLVQTNGHVLDRARLGIPQAMRPTLLQGQGNRLADVSHSGGSMVSARRSWAAAWPSAISTATVGPILPPAPLTPPLRCSETSRAAARCWRSSYETVMACPR